MSVVFVAPASAVCEAPAPVAEHVSRCLPCRGASTRRVRGAFASGGVQQKGRDIAASSPFICCSEQQRRCGVTIANCCCGSSGLQRRWLGTSGNACRVRGACSNLARSACASGKVPAVLQVSLFYSKCWMVNRFHVGRLYAWCWKSFVVLSRVKLDMRDASPRSAQPLPSGPFVCPVLLEVGSWKTGWSTTTPVSSATWVHSVWPVVAG